MISLLKFLDGNWDQAKGYLRDDLDHLESALNQRWGATFGDANLLNVATTVTGTLDVDHGGTGAVSFTAHGVMLGEGTSPLGVTAAGTTGNALIGVTGADPVYGKIGLTTHVSGTLPVANGGTGATTLLIHGVLLGNTTGAIATTAVGATGTVLVGNTGADPSFSTSVSVTSGTFSALTATRVVFAGVGGLLSDDADLTFATDTLTATKLVAPTSVSTPSLISIGAVTITPLAGTNLNVALSTTGDFAVNTNQLYVDTSTTFVGVGTATPGSLFTVEKDDIQITSTDGIVIQNLTAALVGTTRQYSPRLRWRANVWDTDDVVSRTIDFTAEAIVVTSASPTAVLQFLEFTNGTQNTCNLAYVVPTVVGNATKLIIMNGDNTSGTSQAQIVATVGGTGGGDPACVFGISGVVNWSFGLDNSDSDKFKIGNNSTVGTSTALTIDGTLRVGIGVSSPTAFLHLLAGTATANTAPLKFGSGALLTAAEAGAVEFLTDKYYGTITTGAARKTFAFLESPALVTPDIGAATGTSLSLSNTINLIATGGAPTSGTLTMVLGTKTVNTTAATATCLIFFQRVTAGGTIGFATTYTKVNNTSFTVSSDSALDTSTYNWWIVETH